MSVAPNQTVPPPMPSPPPVPSPPPILPPSPMQLYLDGMTFAKDLASSGGVSAILADAALMHDLETAPGGIFNPYLDEGFFAEMAALQGNHNG